MLPFGDFTGRGVPDPGVIDGFRAIILDFYRANRRTFPWRETADPYEIVVSEVMLQQTQTERVMVKWGPFIERFPGFDALADAPFSDILALWQGMGYNRRARALKDIAVIVRDEWGGKLPESVERLSELPMIGRATASAICAFAFSMPTVFLETNIRRVYIHFFFSASASVHDREIVPIAGAALDRENPRDWYYALMDYGVFLKKALPNPNRRSVHYTRQPPFEGSNRQIRGSILRNVAACGGTGLERLTAELPYDEERIVKCVYELMNEGFLAAEDGRFRIAD